MASNTTCDWVDTISDLECVGDSLDTINGNFKNLQDALCSIWSLFPPGMIVLYTGTAAPSGWAICDGSYISQITYPTLYSICGTKYGPTAGNSFKLPDMRGRTAVGAGTGIGLTARTLASIGGEETVTLTSAQNAAHTHTLYDPGHAHTGSASAHTHAVNDPGHVHTLTEAGHSHNVYYGMDQSTLTGNTSAGSTPGAKAPSVAQINYGNANATSSTSVYQAQHSIGPYNDNNSGGTLANTVPGTYWFQNSNNGGTQLLFGDTASGYWFANVNAKTTANPLQVTINDAASNVTMASQRTNITVNATTTTVHVGVASAGITMGSSGSGAAHNNMQPYIALHYIIKLL